jgi:hypothetical protein
MQRGCLAAVSAQPRSTIEHPTQDCQMEGVPKTLDPNDAERRAGDLGALC